MIKMSSHTIGILSVFAVCACAYTPEELGQFLRVGLSNIQRETIDGPTTIEGTVPTWLEGNFVRHACGSFGHTESRDKNLPNYIGHLFDCTEIGQKFRIQNGTVTFTNKWYDTVVNDIYNYYHRDMNLSSVFLVSTYSKVNPGQVDAWRANFSSTSKVPEVPHVSWWQVGNQAIAMSETPIGVVVDPNSLQQHGNAQYTDQNMGFPDTPAHGFTNNPAHEHTEPDGTLWSTVISTTWLGPTKLNLKRVVYKVGADRYRHVVGQYDYGTADLTLCHGRSRYPDPALRPGYLHSFCMTENYIILPEAAYMFDPCAYTHYDGHVPFFPQAFSFEPRAFSRLLVMRRSDGTFVGEAHLQPFFVTHQLGSYEVNGEARLDMLMYDDASVYDKITYVDALLGPGDYSTNVSRITVNLTDFRASISSLRRPDASPAFLEMSNINYAYNGRKYTYGYMVRNFDMREQNAIVKLNVDTGAEVEHVFPEGTYVQEPQFVPRPGAVFEDDGLLLTQGFDGVTKKAIMAILDARTMTLLGKVTARELALFGLHNRLFPLNVGSFIGTHAEIHVIIG